MKLLISLSIIFLIACDKQEQSIQVQNNIQEMRRFLPSETHMIFYAHVHSVFNSGILKNEWEERRKNFNEKADSLYEEFISVTQFNIEKDLQEVLISIHSIDKEEKPVIIAYGNFNPDKLFDFAMSKANSDSQRISVTNRDFNEFKIYTVTGRNNKKMDIAFQANLMILSPENNIESVLNSSNNLTDKRLDKQLNDMAGNQVFAILSADEFKRQLKDNEPFKNANLDLIDFASFSFNAGEEMHVNMNAVCSSEEKAKDFLKICDGLIALARVAVSSERDLIDLMNEVELKQSTNQVSAHVKIDKQRLDKLKKIEKKVDSI